MSTSAHFSVTTAGAFVLGGVAAIVLATTIAVSRSKGRSGVSAPVSSSLAAPSSSASPRPAASHHGGPPEVEVEYPLDPGD